jgi:hypothetical protein
MRKPNQNKAKINVVAIFGHEGVGKTTLSSTAQEFSKTYMLDMENRNEDIATIKNLSGIDNPTSYLGYLGFVDECIAISKKEQGKKTAIIDGATDLLEMVKIQFLSNLYKERLKKELKRNPTDAEITEAAIKAKIYPFTDYAQIDKMLFIPMRELIQNGFMVVVNTQAKEIYKEDKGTGVYEPKFRKGLSFMADIIIEVTKDSFIVRKAKGVDKPMKLERTETLLTIIKKCINEVPSNNQ